MFITVLTKTCRETLYWARWSQFTTLHSHTLRFLLILSYITSYVPREVKNKISFITDPSRCTFFFYTSLIYTSDSLQILSLIQLATFKSTVTIRVAYIAQPYLIHSLRSIPRSRTTIHSLCYSRNDSNPHHNSSFCTTHFIPSSMTLSP
jgi:hypothetical protein